MRRILVLLVVLAAIIVVCATTGAWSYVSAGWSSVVARFQAEPVTYRTAEMTRGDLTATIGATGTVEPEELVDVGAQVSGQINSFGKDKAGKMIDYGSFVEEGMVLAQIDASLYAADAAQAQATLAQANAGVQHAVADIEQMKAKLVQAQRDWDRAKKLGPSEALAQSAFDAYESAYETAKANVAVGEAAIVQAKTSVAQAQAALQRAQRNLSYCTITSPVKGVVIDRRVNAGQTVVSSLSASSMFLIAKDLRRMQVWVAVNEADIGNIHPGQPVTFSVDAFPSQKFRGEVGKIRYNASMTQNVVTYTVEVNTDNSNLKLLPYLTANVQFELGRREDVLVVPNGALRWSPQQIEQVAPELRSTFAAPAERRGEGTSRPEGASGRSASQPASQATSQGARKDGRRGWGTVWVQDGKFVRPIKVRTGLTDGANTEVQGEGLAEGTAVILGEQRHAEGAAAAVAPTSSPFQPQLRPPGGGGRR